MGVPWMESSRSRAVRASQAAEETDHGSSTAAAVEGEGLHDDADGDEQAWAGELPVLDRSPIRRGRSNGECASHT